MKPLSLIARVVRRLALLPAVEGLWAMTIARNKSHLLRRLAPPHVDFPSPSVRCVTRSGLKLEIDASDYMEWIAYYGIEEPGRDVLLAAAVAGFTVFDVGANVGELALRLSQRVGPSGRVFAFEPAPSVYERLERNIRANRSAANVRPFNVAISSFNGFATLVSPTLRNRGGAFVAGSIDESRGVRVPTRRLDDVALDAHVRRVDLLKVDVEGHELSVLCGARRTIERDHPILFVELDDGNLRRNGASAEELVAEIRSMGYEVRNAITGELVASADLAAHQDVIAVWRRPVG